MVWGAPFDNRVMVDLPEYGCVTELHSVSASACRGGREAEVVEGGTHWGHSNGFEELGLTRNHILGQGRNHGNRVACATHTRPQLHPLAYTCHP